MRISALALLKMAMHAKSGGNLEVMGVMQGKVRGDTFIVIDAFALPVEGTETRVNAQVRLNPKTLPTPRAALAHKHRPPASDAVIGDKHSVLNVQYTCFVRGRARAAPM